jgi:hypothetical protein
MARKIIFAKPSIKGRAARERYDEVCIDGKSIGHAVGGEKGVGGEYSDQREETEQRPRSKTEARERDRDQRPRTANKEGIERQHRTGTVHRIQEERPAEMTIAALERMSELSCADSADHRRTIR